MKKLFLILIVGVLALPLVAAEENCKLVVHTRYTDGSRALAVLDVFAATRQECKLERDQREINSNPEKILEIKASFGWRDPQGF